MKRALIATFYNEVNYGAVFQSYALQKKLESYFDEVRVIDYRPDVMKNKDKLINCASIKALILSIITLPIKILRKCVFRKFVKRHIDTIGVEEISNDKNCLDYVFLGSDQIWNPQITGGVDPVFFGVIPGFTGNKTIAYAPSIGKNKITELELSEMKTLIKNIDCISVREQEAKDIVSEITSKDISIVCDPTLLLRKDDWDKLLLSSNISRKNEHYVFVYSLSQNPDVIKLAQKIALDNNSTIIEAYLGRKYKKGNKRHKIKYYLSPEDFISYLSSADYVVTDSFHGTVFSIIYNKNFYTVPYKGKEGRIEYLLKKTGLENRIVRDISMFNYICNSNNTVFNSGLKQFVEDSELYLKKGIEFDEKQN